MSASFRPDPVEPPAYALSATAVETGQGEWSCLLSYDDLPGCEVMDPDPYRALDLIDECRDALIAEFGARGEPLPTPRWISGHRAVRDQNVQS
jgi:hypothetical protein